MRKDIISMSAKELEKLTIIRQVKDKKIRQKEAAERLGLCQRQIRRILKKFREDGPKGLIHGLRGKRSHRATKEAEKQQILKLWSDKYVDFGPTLFSEKLLENEGIIKSDETIRGWYPADLPKPKWKRKGKKIKRKLRSRRQYFGELNQMDGSWHDWFEGRGPKCNLQGLVDDATSEVFALFTEYEGTLPAMRTLKAYSQRYGLPHCFYFDMHSTYKSQKRLSKEERLAGAEALSQFQRALKDLGIKWIHAYSPQAKGRVERIFGTFQDRLIKEMRLANISSIDQANAFLKEYLPKYNKRFRKPAAQKGDWHKKHFTPKQISQALCLKETRQVQKDSTIQFQTRRYLITDAICQTKVTVETHLDGKLILRAPTGKELNYKRIPLELYEHRKQEKRKEQKAADSKRKPKSKAHLPAANHPWRKDFSRRIDQNRAKKQALSTGGCR